MPSNKYVNERKRRKRTLISMEQHEKLEQAFRRNQWPNRGFKERLAKDIKMSEQVINIWFQNQRARLKREEEYAKISRTKHLKSSDPDSNVQFEKKPEIPGTSSEHRLSGLSEMDSLHSEQATPRMHRILIAPKGIFKNIGVEPASPARIELDGTEKMRLKAASEPNKPRSSLETLTPLLTSTIIPRHVQSDLPLTRTNTPSTSHAVMSRAEGNTPLTNTLFEAIVDMIALAEGGIIQLDDDKFDQAANDALYGIVINGTHRLVYSTESGLNLIPFTPMSP